MFNPIAGLVIGVVDYTKVALFAKCYLLCMVNGKFTTTHVSNAHIYYLDKAGRPRKNLLYHFERNNCSRIVGITYNGQVCKNPLVVEANTTTTRGMYNTFREFYEARIGEVR